MKRTPYSSLTPESDGLVANADSCREVAAVLQVEFPTLGLANCPGDSEGVNEMNESAALLRQLCAVFERAGTAEHQPLWPYTATARGEVQLGFFGACVSV